MFLLIIEGLQLGKGLVILSTLSIFRGSSVAEKLAVNQLVAGSNPALGASKKDHQTVVFFTCLDCGGIRTGGGRGISPPTCWGYSEE